jgi:hypothetical protein
MMRKYLGIALVLALALTWGVGSAMADSITYMIDNPNSALSGFTGPYATVEVDLTSSTAATITFTSLTTNGITFLIGDNSAAGVNVAGTFSLGTITPTFLPGFSGTFSNGGSGNMDGFGTFNLTISDNCGYPCAASQLVFSLTATGGTTWGSASSILTANSQGAFVAFHGFACTSPCTVAEGALNTGFAANGGAVNTPEPASALLLGAGLTGIGIWKRRKDILA